MERLGGVFWRLLGDVRPRERPRFLFFAALATLLGLAQTLGFVGVEALFLAEFGAARLPETFIAASLATVAGSLVYAARVGETRNDELFIWMLAGASAALAAAVVGITAGMAWLLPALFCFYYLTQAVFVNHLWTFTGDYFDTVASKRLLPLFTLGSSIGGFLGGGAAVGVTRIAGPVSLIGAWAVFLVSGALLLRLGRRGLRRWGPLDLEEADETSVEGMRGALRYVRSSRLAGWMVASALGMVLALFVAQYLYSDIFARRFRSPDALAAFFGVYLAVTNLIEVVLEVAVTPRLIRRTGVASANLVHPVLTLLSFGGLAYQYTLVVGIAARVNRELLENAIAGPVRALTYNALPMRFRGRMRAFLEGIVVYAGMSAAGLMLLVVGRPHPLWLCAAGGVTATIYLIANLRVRREYMRTMVEELKAGRIDLADVSDDIGTWQNTRLADLWEQMVHVERERPSRTLMQMIPGLAERGVVDPLVRALDHPSPELRRACVNALAGVQSDRVEAALVRAFSDPDASVRLSAIRGIARSASPADLAPRVRALLADPDPGVRAEVAVGSGDEGLRVLEEMIASDRPAVATAALRVAPAALLGAILARVRDPDPAIRAAAMECAARTASEPPLDLHEALDVLHHPDSRIRRSAVLLMANFDDEKALAGLAQALGDESPEVQFAAETVLGSLAEAGVTAASPYLSDDRERAVEAALRVVAHSGAGNARELLARELRRHVRELWYDVIAYQYLPADSRLGSLFLRAAYQDAMLRHRRLAFRILQLLEDPAVIRKVEKVLRFGTLRKRGDALEVLSNLGDREAAQLLVLMHEGGPLEERAHEVTRILPLPSNSESFLEESRRSDVHWIRRAALALDGPCPAGEEQEMERLLALKRVPLFQHLSLEQLDAIHQITREAHYVGDEVIVREGDAGGELFLLIEGTVRFYKNHGGADERLLGTQEAISYFGEMATLDDEPRSATCVADGSARLLVLDGSSLKELILQMPEMSFEIFRVLTSRVRTAEARLGKD